MEVQIQGVVLKWAETSHAVPALVLKSIFKGEGYDLKFLQPIALNLLEIRARKGDDTAFDIMRAKIGIPQIKTIAIKPEVIAAADIAGIDIATGGWTAFLRAKGVLE